MQSKRIWIIALAIIVSILIVIVVTYALTPQNTDPAYLAALEFVEAVRQQDDPTAFALLSDDLQTYVRDNCPDGSVSACINAYTPPEWGKMLSAVFRRAAPDGPNFDVDIIATYAEDKGFSGVCIYQRMEQDAAGEWKVYAWAGYVSCGDGASRNMAHNLDAPNRVP
ncbi:MAG: hypothetical protein H6672_07520 [Anaerolineaceae bacterium]|nr:hypothetical protein [Anaerolineaceae bacterium]